MRRFSLLGLWLIALPLFAKDGVSFRNDREGQSFYWNNSAHRTLTRALQDFNGEEIKEVYRKSLNAQEESKLCAFDLNASMRASFIKKSPRFEDYEGALHYLRSQNEIDDVALKILLDADRAVNAAVDLPKDPNKLSFPDRKKMKEMISLVASFESRFKKNNCLDEAYKSFMSELKKLDKNIKSAQVEGLLVEAYEKKAIKSGLYLSLERLRAGEVEASMLSLKSYHQKLKSLRLHKPLRDPSERSDFITNKADKLKVSYRIRLMESYTDIQIMLMGDLIKKLRTRLESPKVEIIVHGRNTANETITLEPMERFRFAIKMLRKDMSMLATNSYFAGRVPDYMDLISAAYETSIIPATELKELGGLQEIWNPKKSFWDKAKIWIRTFSSVATIAIPQPYGFIPALVLVVIEATTGKDDPNAIDDTSIF